MTSAAPKAIKAFVTSVVKDQILEADYSSNVTIPFLALLRMELIQRGVMVSLNIKDEEDIKSWDSTKTLEAVRSTVGKELLEAGGPVPVQLLSASAVMAGRVAELCASLSLPNKDFFDSKLLQSTLDRCQEVHDERFLVILNLFMEQNNNSDNNETITAKEEPSLSKEILLQMAEGYFLRGAHYQADLPPIWKRVCDVVLLRKGLSEQDPSPGENAHALSNMVRIAASKGNEKRATELKVRLVESYLQYGQQQQYEYDNTNNLQPNSKQQSKNNMLPKTTVLIFVTPYKPSIQNPLEKAQKALEDCQKHLDLLSAEDIFVLQLLDVQIQLAQETSHIESEAQHQYQQAQNRAEEKPTKAGGGSNKATTTTTTTKPLSLSAIRDKTRNQVLRQDQYGVSADSANQLRDAYLAQCGVDKEGGGGSSARNTLRKKSAAELLGQILCRFRDRARAMSKVKTNPSMQGWSDLAGFLVPFLNFAMDANNNPKDNKQDQTTIQTWIESVSGEDAKLIETFTVMAPCVEWMTCSSSLQEVSSRIPKELFPLIYHILTVLVDQAVQAKQEYQAASNVLKSSTETMDLKIRELECARASVQSLLFFQQGSHQAPSSSDLRTYTEQAVTMAQRTDKYLSISVPYGTAFWNLMLAWSGLQQATPWTYCTAPEARLVQKFGLQQITQAQQEWGRPIAPVEQMVLDLAQADLECGLLAGGFRSVASKLYHAMLKGLETPIAGMAGPFQSVLKSHCLIGLTRINLLEDQGDNSGKDSALEKYAQRSIQELSTISLDQDIPSTYLWTSPNATMSFVKLHMSVSRQLVADSLVRVGRSQEAKTFLEDAVRDAPTDAEAAFSLGAFLLREAYSVDDRAAQDLNTAKMQLLKAAKLDSRKAGPFALLGIWYEEQMDLKRALGCYSKALLLDPPHPVAGRGVLRLAASLDSVKSVIDNAIQASSPVNGWAWRALGNQKVMVTGENDLGAVALLKALRCRDIDCPQSEPLSAFYNKPKTGVEDTDEYLGKERAEAWSELALCYRQIGRYTAAIRGYYSSMEAAGDHVSASVLCACAEAELGLGLAEEAAEKFTRALHISGPSTKPIAAYGQGSAFLSLAQRDAQDGKLGAAFTYMKEALDGFKESKASFSCTQKLLGDLYSFGASLPPDVFGSTNDQENPIQEQISFVQNGESCYRAAVELSSGISVHDEESNVLNAALITDTGANILLQAQLKAFHRCKGLSYTAIEAKDNFPEVKDLYEKAAAEFRRAIDQCPTYAPAWCGLGCAVLPSDPLLAQHSFCRSIQLDSLAPAAYSNLGFLCTSYNSFSSSIGVLDALTQVADSPMMWINRALILERNAASDIANGDHSKAEDAISKAADAYRAALQVVKHPSALLGLALSSRVSTSSGKGNSPKSSQARKAFQESYGYLLEYEGISGTSDATVKLLESLWTLERGTHASHFGDEDEDSLGSANKVAEQSLEQLESLNQQFSEGGSGKSDHLDLELIRQCLKDAKNTHPRSEEEEMNGGPQMTMTLARQIVHEPFRGDLWVELAKELSRGIAAATSTNSRKTALESARIAASRAVDILTHQLTYPNHQAGTHKSSWEVKPEALSEALSLVYWLENLQPKQGGDGAAAVEEEKEEGAHLIKCFELQKALIICPGNKFAREALLASSIAT